MAAGWKCAESPRVGRVPRPNSFVIITANRVIHCNTDMAEEMRVETMELCVTACEKFATNNEVSERGVITARQLVHSQNPLNSAVISAWDTS